MGASFFALMENLISKYNVPGPRYTSYPTVPHWKNILHTEATWKKSVVDCFWKGGNEVSLYIHLPFCESLCTYCGCTKRITKNHSVEDKYIDYVLKEWSIYKATLPTSPIIREIHLGGGTPTFFSPENLRKLINGLTQGCWLSQQYEFGFEGHPNNTTEEHLIALSEIGFTRISLGIQDFNEEVQEIINRKQTLEQVEKVTQLARKYGFKSINFDLIYGLPKQSVDSIKDTIAKTVALGPTRIAFYGYAHIPWIMKSQTSFEEHLPKAEERLAMYELGKAELTNAGYKDIGMDHFATEDDKLYKAFKDGSLHRSFMGYTTQDSDLLIGLGMSSISDSWTAFSQNAKDLKTYYEMLDQDQLPIIRGHHLTAEDLSIRKHILNLMCRFETKWQPSDDLVKPLFNFDLLEELENDGLIEMTGFGIKVTPKGKPFIRNVCMALDAHLWENQKISAFSQTV